MQNEKKCETRVLISSMLKSRDHVDHVTRVMAEIRDYISGYGNARPAGTNR